MMHMQEQNNRNELEISRLNQNLKVANDTVDGQASSIYQLYAEIEELNSKMDYAKAVGSNLQNLSTFVNDLQKQVTDVELDTWEGLPPGGNA
jgi:chromosome segregation ATPase